ncbi:MAG: hypothetical protein LBL15_01160 [Oscillospiraceae bacterium]|nr:hypothetical protein [Oscillospiraceae bacterium]
MKKNIITAILAGCLVAVLLVGCGEVDNGVVSSPSAPESAIVTETPMAETSPSMSAETTSPAEVVGEIKAALRGDDYRFALDYAETDAFTALIKSGGRSQYVSGDGFSADLDGDGELTIVYFDITGGGDINSLNGTEYFMWRMDIAYNGEPAVALKCGKSDVSGGKYNGQYEEYWYITGDWKLVSSWKGNVVDGGFEGTVSYYGANSGTSTERYERGYDGVNMSPDDRMPFPAGEEGPDLGTLDVSLVLGSVASAEPALPDENAPASIAASSYTGSFNLAGMWKTGNSIITFSENGAVNALFFGFGGGGPDGSWIMSSKADENGYYTLSASHITGGSPVYKARLISQDEIELYGESGIEFGAEYYHLYRQ